ncbi:MAG: heme lyase CcmF/NrfE family subunit [Thermoleophilia bacterium]|nr:heme lyase CcmF/NrfE family subunit [Thermoleophilia bacterium]
MTLAILGQSLVLLALLAAATGAVVSFIGGRRLLVATPDAPAERDRELPATTDRLANLGGRLLQVLLFATIAASFLLILGLVSHDFTLAYVHGRTSLDLPVFYRITSYWSGQEGSLLMWLTVLAAFGVFMMRSLRKARVSAAMLSFATGIVLAVASFFALLVAVVSRPFAVVEQIARDGAGMSPSLQNYWMAVHPPALYIGYVGVTVPFAIVAGALLARRRDDAWIATTRSWVMLSWIFLTLGLILGARWAYEEIGWGGYWAWDPVENAALMPWLTATALMHSIMVQQRRGMMRFWNAVLATLGFALSIFGTFITRSGVLSSVHSFVSSPVGWWFIAALIVIAVGAMTLLFRSRDILHAKHDVDAVVSRESLLLFNNLLFVSLALVVLWGVVYPIMTAALAGSRISLEKPWYDFFAAAFGLPLTFLVAFAPFIAWRGTPLKRTLAAMKWPFLLCVTVGVVLVLAGAGSSPVGIAAVSLGALVIFGVLTDLRRSVQARRAAEPEESVFTSVRGVVVRQRRRMGAWLAHAGFGLVVIAIAGTAWGHSTTRDLQQGDRFSVHGYSFHYVDVSRHRGATSMQTRAVFDVRRGGTNLGQMKAGRDFYPASGELSNEVAIEHEWLRARDVFVSMDRITETGAITVKVFINPLVPLLWLGGIIIVLGALLAALPSRRSAFALDRVDSNDGNGVQEQDDAVHELRNGTAAPR